LRSIPQAKQASRAGQRPHQEIQTEGYPAVRHTNTRELLADVPPGVCHTKQSIRSVQKLLPILR